jgi:hypothetical protein
MLQGPGAVEIALLLGAAFLFVCILASKVSTKLGVPSLLLFVGIGLLAGSEGPGGIAFEDFALTKQVGLVLLAFILFSGGLDTDWKEIKPVAARNRAFYDRGRRNGGPCWTFCALRSGVHFTAGPAAWLHRLLNGCGGDFRRPSMAGTEH